MLYSILYSLHGTYSALNVMKYITFRTLLRGDPRVPARLSVRSLAHPHVGELAGRPADPHRRSGAPSNQGGHADDGRHADPVLAGLVDTSARRSQQRLCLAGCSASRSGFGAIGFVDDWRKFRRRQSLGLRARQKLVAQFAFALVAGMHSALEERLRLDDDHAVPQERPARPRLVLRAVRGAGDRRRLERGEPHRRARWPRDRARDDRGARLHDVLPTWPAT